MPFESSHTLAADRSEQDLGRIHTRPDLGIRGLSGTRGVSVIRSSNRPGSGPGISHDAQRRLAAFLASLDPLNHYGRNQRLVSGTAVIAEDRYRHRGS